MIFSAYANGRADVGGAQFRCAVGASGVIPAHAKREGDGASPEGVWPLRRVLFRADRTLAPATRLPAEVLRRNSGWCDDPADPNYNSPVILPYPASAERLWRDDGIYDLVVVIGHNDSPPIPGAGSAIFLHLARDDFSPTQGCVALGRVALETLLAAAAPGDCLAILSD